MKIKSAIGTQKPFFPIMFAYKHFCQGFGLGTGVGPWARRCGCPALQNGKDGSKNSPKRLIKKIITNYHLPTVLCFYPKLKPSLRAVRADTRQLTVRRDPACFWTQITKQPDKSLASIPVIPRPCCESRDSVYEGDLSGLTELMERIRNPPRAA